MQRVACVFKERYRLETWYRRFFRRVYLSRARLRAELSQKVVFLFYLRPGERGAPAGELGEGGGAGCGRRGWLVGERPPARSPAAGVVEGGGGLRI